MTTAHTPLFYRGDLDDRAITGDHGAILNGDYHRLMTEGPWGKVQKWTVCSGVHCMTGFGVNNYTLIEGKTGYILIDTGLNIGCGLEVLRWKSEVGSKPVVAIIYSHNHYTAGTEAICAAHPDRTIPIYAHPGVNENMFGLIEPGTLQHALDRRADQIGVPLPKQGADAGANFGFCVPQFDDPKLNKSGYFPATREVTDGEEMVIDGVRVRFYHTVADANDSLITYFPDHDFIQHNAALMPVIFPLYTLRGGSYRDPVKLIKGIDCIRELRPQYLVGCHGFPVSGKDKIYDFVTIHRDAYAWLLQQTIQSIGRGLNPNELANTVRLPDFFANHPTLFPAYVDVEYIVRGIYQGVIGWWADDAADLHPPTPEEFGAAIIEGFGGSDNVVKRAQSAFDENKYNLTAKLLSIILAADPDNSAARHLKAAALRRMAQATRSGVQTRNFMLVQALRLEGKLNERAKTKMNALVTPFIDYEVMLDEKPGALLRLLENHIDARRSEGLIATIKFVVPDQNTSCGLAIRRGAVEFLNLAPDHYDLEITFNHPILAQIAAGHLTLQKAIDQGLATMTGNLHLQKDVMESYTGILGA